MKIERIKNGHYKIIYEPYETNKISYCEAMYSTDKDLNGEAKFFDMDGNLISRFVICASGYKIEMPVSFDGKKVYVYNSTSVKHCISCYDIISGTLIWVNDNKAFKDITAIELLDNILVCEIYDIGVCILDATTGEMIRWLLSNSGLTMWRITRELIVIWNCYKMKMYCYDIENDVLRILPFDFNAKKYFNELLAQGKVASWNVHFAIGEAKVDDNKLKVHLFVSHYNFRGDYFEEVSMSEVVGKGKVFVYKPRNKA